MKTNKFFHWELQLGHGYNYKLYTVLISNSADIIYSTVHIYYTKYTKPTGKYS